MKQKKVNKPSYTPLEIPEEQPEDSGLGTIDLTKLLADMEENKGEIVLSQPLSGVNSDVMSQLKQLYGEKTEKPEALGLASAISPKFNVKTAENSEFIVQNERVKEQKRKITEELSDVSLDDE